MTIDQRIRYQQNIAGLTLGVVAIEVPDTRIAFLYPLLPELRNAIERVRPGEVLVIRQQPA